VAAAAERSVMLIDVDLSSPGLAGAVGVECQAGWDDSIRGGRALRETLRHVDPNEVVACLPLAQPVDRPDELLGHPALPDWLGGLRQEYGLILLDGGSVWDSGARWAPWVDVALVVCDGGRTVADEWAQAWDRLEEGGTHVLGIVERSV
jgi:Mrp family chromosome partitioning ATPase